MRSADERYEDYIRSIYAEDKTSKYWKFLLVLLLAICCVFIYNHPQNYDTIEMPKHRVTKSIPKKQQTQETAEVDPIYNH